MNIANSPVPASVPAQVRADLDVARLLIRLGVPLFIARLKANGDPVCPTGWQHAKPNPAVIGRWKPGLALCAVTGVIFDVLDVDPRNGSAESLKALRGEISTPRIYGRAATCSGGDHWWIAPLGIGTHPNFRPGLDLKGGAPDGSSRGFVFVPPTVRTAKGEFAGQRRPYAWAEGLAVAEAPAPGDGTGGQLAELILGGAESGDDSGESPESPEDFSAPLTLDDAQDNTFSARVMSMRARGYPYEKVRADLLLAISRTPLKNPRDPFTEKDDIQRWWKTANRKVTRQDEQAEAELGGRALREVTSVSRAPAAAAEEAAEVAAGPASKAGGKAGEFWNDAGHARLLARLHGADMRFVPALGRWFCWNGKIWADDQGRANVYALDVMRARLKEVDRAAEGGKISDEKGPRGGASDAARMRDAAKALGNDARVKAILRQAALLPGMSVPLENFDYDRRLLTVINGTLVLARDGAGFRESRRGDYCTRMVPVAYEAGARSAAWQDFLQRFVTDEDEREYLLRLLGYSLLGANPERVLVFLHGPGSTGKTTLCELTARMYGPGMAGTFSLSMLREKGQDAPRPDLIKAARRRFIHASEASPEWKFRADMIKRVAGNDTISARGMHSDEFSDRKPDFVMFIATNALPAIEDSDSALRGRLIGFPMTCRVSGAEDDKHFADDFPAGELPGILASLVRGYDAYARDGLGDMPPRVEEETRKLGNSLSGTDQFLSECCLRRKGDDSLRWPARELYEALRLWWKRDGREMRECPTETAFGAALTDRGHPGGKPARFEGRPKQARPRFGVELKPAVSKAVDHARTMGKLP